MRGFGAIGLVCAVTAVVPASPAYAAGQLDPTFSSDGVTEIQFGSLEPEAGFANSTTLKPIGIDPTGQIVLAGATTYARYCFHVGCEYVPTPTVARLRSDGTLDETFSSDGIFEGEAGPRLPSLFTQPSLQPDGKVLFGGENGQPTVTRLNQDGTIDTAFGQGGTASFPVPNAYVSETAATATAADGQILVAVQSAEDASQNIHDLTVVRLNPDGTVDQSFGDSGETQIRLPFLSATVGAIALDRLGRVVVSASVASMGPGNPNGRQFFYRFTDAGAPDPGFGADGRVDYPLADFNPLSVPPMAVDSQGRIYSLIADRADAILRLTESGDPDASFGPGGVHRIDDIPPPATGPLTSIATASSDRLLIGVKAPGRLVISRRLRDGTPDPGFGSAGWASAPTLVTSTEGASAIEAPGGQVVAAAGSTDHPCAAVARFTSDADGSVATGLSDGKPCATICRPSEGCPSIHRTLTIGLRNRGHARRITGVLSADPAGCAESVVLLQKSPGPDVKLRSDHSLRRRGRANYRYSIRIGPSFPGGRVYTRAYPQVDPGAGTCLGARSPVIRLRDQRLNPRALRLGA